jgi:hypothetical protein
MSAAPLVAQSPEVGSVLVQLLQWAAAGFKGAATIEGVLDQFARTLEQKAMAPPPPPPPPTPEDQKHLAQAGKAGAEAKKTEKEAALIPPMELAPQGPPMAPGGPQPAAGAGMPPPGGMPPGAMAPPMQPQPMPPTQ